MLSRAMLAWNTAADVEFYLQSNTWSAPMSPKAATILFLGIVAGTWNVALAQTSPPASEKAAPQAGANSFTESQARERMQGAGFTEVTGLRKDDQGIWRVRAKQGGRQVNLSLDFRGNITTE